MALPCTLRLGEYISYVNLAMTTVDIAMWLERSVVLCDY